MTVQVTTTPPGTVETFSYDPASDAPPLVAGGPGLLQFRDIRPDGSLGAGLGPVWGPGDIHVLGATA